MVVTEHYKTREDGVRLVRTYSDLGKRIIQNETGNVYDEAIDVETSGYTYTESEDNGQDLSAEEALSILLGGAE